MKAKSKTNYYYIGIAVAALAVGWLMFGSNFQTANGDFNDSGLAANIRFTDSVIGTDIQGAPRADILDPYSNLGTFSVFTASGTDITNANITVGMKGKVLTSGTVPVKNYVINGTLYVKIDGKDFKSYSLYTTGNILPSDGIVTVKINGAKERSISVKQLQNFWGVYNYGQHKVSLFAKATIDVTFADGQVGHKSISTVNVGSVTLTSKSDASVTGFEVGSQLGT